MSPKTGAGGLDRVAGNELLFLGLAKHAAPSSRTGAMEFAAFACECANDACAANVELSLEQYAPVRTCGTRFVVVAGDAHVHADRERIVERRQLYWVVERRQTAELLAFFGHERTSPRPRRRPSSARLRRARVAANERLFDRLVDHAQTAPRRSFVLPVDFACECDRADCVEAIELTISEYDAVRTDGSRHAVSPHSDHVARGTDVVLERHQTYWVVAPRPVGEGVRAASSLGRGRLLALRRPSTKTGR